MRSTKWAALCLGALGLIGCNSNDTSDTIVRAESPATEAGDTAIPGSGRTEVPAGETAASAEQAVRDFLDAEIAGDHARSFGLLADEERALYAPLAYWVEAHADIPRFRGYRIDRVDAGGQVVVEASLESSLDLVNGLIPARARFTFVTVPEGGGHRVAFDRSTLAGIYPDDRLATDAVSSWVASRQECGTGTQFTPLVGTPSLADTLCGTTGPITTASPVALDEVGDLTSTVNAFGPDAVAWARAVPVTSPVALTVVVAPVDDAWLVIGVGP